jgi:hypothetical protein
MDVMKSRGSLNWPEHFLFSAPEQAIISGDPTAGM